MLHLVDFIATQNKQKQLINSPKQSNRNENIGFDTCIEPKHGGHELCANDYLLAGF